MIEITRFGNPFKGAEDSIRAVISEACIRVASQARELAPEDTGDLKGSIVWKTIDAQSGELDVSPKEGEGYVGSRLEYATYQEYGTRYMAPQPFLRPAIARIIKGQSINAVLAKIAREKMLGALKKGENRVKF